MKTNNRRNALPVIRSREPIQYEPVKVATRPTWMVEVTSRGYKDMDIKSTTDVYDWQAAWQEAQNMLALGWREITLTYVLRNVGYIVA